MTKKPEVKIKKFLSGIVDQTCSDDNGNCWYIVNLIEKSKDLPVLEIPLSYLFIDYYMKCLDIREFVSRMKNVMEADLDFPILLDYNGCLFDGRHRIAKALFQGKETIKAKRFEEYIKPDYNTKEK